MYGYEDEKGRDQGKQIAFCPDYRKNRRARRLARQTLAHVRKLIKEADPNVIEEWKWRGVPFQSSLEGNLRRAIDLYEGDTINEAAFKELVRAAVRLNSKRKN